MHPEDEIADILATWREQYGQADSADPEEVIRRNPQHAEALRAHFEALRIAEQALRVSEPGSTSAADGDPEAPLRPIAADKYVGFDPVGQGGMGIVYWAIDTDLNREVAFKVVRPLRDEAEPQVPEEPGAITPPDKDTPAAKAFATLRRRFLREATVTGRLEHPGIVPVYEVGATAEGVPYFTMRFIHGRRTLADAIDEVSAEPLESRLKLLDPFLRVCDTIHYAHSHGVIHRDLKPENVALGDYGEVVVIDWGLARIQDQADPADPRWQEHLRAYRESPDVGTLTGIVGTPGYIAPEALRGEQTDERSDVYALGVLLFQILTGRMPYEITSPAEFYTHVSRDPPPQPVDLDPDVAPALSALCTACLEMDREARPSTAAALVDTIRAWRASRERDRETETLLREARALYAASDGLDGDALLRQLGRASVPLGRVLEHRPGESSALRLMARLEERHSQAVQEHAVATTKRHMRRAGLATLVLVAIGAVIGALVFFAQRRDAEDAREVAREALRREEVRREEATQAARRSRALALAGAARQHMDTDATCALLLAREAAHLLPSRETSQALRDTLGAAHEQVVISIPNARIWHAQVSPDATRVVTVCNRGSVRLWDRLGKERSVLFPPGPRQGMSPGPDGDFSVQFSPTGRHLLVHGHSRYEPQYEAMFRDPVSIFDADGNLVAQLTNASHASAGRFWFSPDGLHVLGLLDWRVDSAGQRDTSRRTPTLWDLSGSLVAEFVGHTDLVRAASFSPDGKRLATASHDGTVRLWALDGSEVQTLAVSNAPVGDVRFSPSGKMLLSSSCDQLVRLWAPEGGLIATLGESRAVPEGCWSVPRARFSPSGDRILVLVPSSVAPGGAGRGAPSTWVDLLDRLANMGYVGLLRAGGGLPSTPRVPCRCSLYDPTGKRTALLCADGETAQVGRFTTDGSHLITMGANRVVYSVGSDGCRRAIACGDFEVSIDAGSRNRSHRAFALLRPHPPELFVFSWEGFARAVGMSGLETQTLRGLGRLAYYPEFTSDGAHLLARFANGKVSLIRVEVGEAAVMHAGGPVGGVRVLEDGETVLSRHTSSDGATVHRRWSIDGELLGSVPVESEGVLCHTWGPRGLLVLASDEDGGLSLRRLPQGDVQRFPDAPATRDDSTALSPDGSHVAVLTHGDWGVTVWGSGGRQCGPIWNSKPANICAGLAPDGTHLLLRPFVGTTARPFGLDLWATNPPRHVAHLDAAVAVPLGGSRTTTVFSPRGDLFVTSGVDAVPVWDLEGRRVATLRGHSRRTSAHFSDSGGQILTYSEDQTVRLWTSHGELLAILRGHHGAVTGASLSPDGSRIVTSSADGTLRVWYTKLEDLLAAAHRRVTREFTDDERARFAELLLEPREPAEAQR